MTKRRTPRARAKSEESKRLVRDAFIAAGRDLYAREGAAGVSLRRIAREAGYTPATIYHYFEDGDELFLAIREQDMASLVEEQERLLAEPGDPANRLRRIHMLAATHWLEHPDQFRILFGSTPMGGDGAKAVRNPFSHTPIARRSYALYEQVVAALAETHPSLPELSFATAMLIALTHGIVGFVLGTPTLPWPDPREMVAKAIDLQLAEWKRLPDDIHRA